MLLLIAISRAVAAGCEGGALFGEGAGNESLSPTNPSPVFDPLKTMACSSSRECGRSPRFFNACKRCREVTAEIAREASFLLKL